MNFKDKYLKIINVNCGMGDTLIKLDECPDLEDVLFMVNCVIDNTAQLIDNPYGVYQNDDLKMSVDEIDMDTLKKMINSKLMDHKMLEIATYKIDRYIYLIIE
jgi:hypothetical protein